VDLFSTAILPRTTPEKAGMLHRLAILDLKSLAQWIILTLFLIGCGGKTCWGSS
jgi:hypothetical protein